MYYLGIDVGGMSVKGGVVDEKGRILYKKTSAYNKTPLLVVDDVVRDLLSHCALKGYKVESVGMGVPCVFDVKTGVVSYGNNLDFENINLKEYFFNNYGLTLKIANDAAAAALGELKFGCAQGYQNAVLITIGTGVGCGIILNGEIIKSSSSTVGELSHTTIKINGRKCSCGKRGCVEAYCSMTALYNDLKREMLRNKKSLLWNEIDINDVDGKTFFKLIGKNEIVNKVYNRFVNYLGIAITNVANLLRPDIILIGGGVSEQGETIIKPINDYLNENIFSKEYTNKIPVMAAKNGNDAGILGAVALLS